MSDYIVCDCGQTECIRMVSVYTDELGHVWVAVHGDKGRHVLDGAIALKGSSIDELIRLLTEAQAALSNTQPQQPTPQQAASPQAEHIPGIWQDGE